MVDICSVSEVADAADAAIGRPESGASLGFVRLHLNSINHRQIVRCAIMLYKTFLYLNCI